MILDPAGAPPAARHAPVRALTSLKDLTVGFIDNSKPNFNHLATDIAAELKRSSGVADVVIHRKRAASIPAPGQIIEDLRSRCDLVITGSGD